MSESSSLFSNDSYTQSDNGFLSDEIHDDSPHSNGSEFGWSGNSDHSGYADNNYGCDSQVYSDESIIGAMCYECTEIELISFLSRIDTLCGRFERGESKDLKQFNREITWLAGESKSGNRLIHILLMRLLTVRRNLASSLRNSIHDRVAFPLNMILCSRVIRLQQFLQLKPLSELRSETKELLVCSLKSAKTMENTEHLFDHGSTFEDFCSPSAARDQKLIVKSYRIVLAHLRPKEALDLIREIHAVYVNETDWKIAVRFVFMCDAAIWCFSNYEDSEMFEELIDIIADMSLMENVSVRSAVVYVITELLVARSYMLDSHGASRVVSMIRDMFLLHSDEEELRQLLDIAMSVNEFALDPLRKSIYESTVCRRAVAGDAEFAIYQINSICGAITYDLIPKVEAWGVVRSMLDDIERVKLTIIDESEDKTEEDLPLQRAKYFDVEGMDEDEIDKCVRVSIEAITKLMKWMSDNEIAELYAATFEGLATDEMIGLEKACIGCKRYRSPSATALLEKLGTYVDGESPRLNIVVSLIRLFIRFLKHKEYQTENNSSLIFAMIRNLTSSSQCLYEIGLMRPISLLGVLLKLRDGSHHLDEEMRDFVMKIVQKKQTTEVQSEEEEETHEHDPDTQYSDDPVEQQGDEYSFELDDVYGNEGDESETDGNEEQSFRSIRDDPTIFFNTRFAVNVVFECVSIAAKNKVIDSRTFLRDILPNIMSYFKSRSFLDETFFVPDGIVSKLDSIMMVLKLTETQYKDRTKDIIRDSAHSLLSRALKSNVVEGKCDALEEFFEETIRKLGKKERVGEYDFTCSREMVGALCKMGTMYAVTRSDAFQLIANHFKRKNERYFSVFISTWMNEFTKSCSEYKCEGLFLFSVLCHLPSSKHMNEEMKDVAVSFVNIVLETDKTYLKLSFSNVDLAFFLLEGLSVVLQPKDHSLEEVRDYSKKLFEYVEHNSINPVEHITFGCESAIGFPVIAFVHHLVADGESVVDIEEEYRRALKYFIKIMFKCVMRALDEEFIDVTFLNPVVLAFFLRQLLTLDRETQAQLVVVVAMCLEADMFKKGGDGEGEGEGEGEGKKDCVVVNCNTNGHVGGEADSIGNEELSDSEDSEKEYVSSCDGEVARQLIRDIFAHDSSLVEMVREMYLSDIDDLIEESSVSDKV